jgi:cyclopropane fatty-acyl-phospholipid synthase-like methyltransferase
VFEAGCSVGTLSVTLAERCDEVVAMDRSEAAVAEARRVVADLALGHVRVHAGVLPKEWPVGPFDLVVLGEVGYYLSEDALAATLRAAAATLDPAGHLVAAHWRHAIEGCSLTGDDVHTRLRAVTGLVHLARYEEEHFLIDVLGRGPSGKSGLPRPE